MQHKGIGHSFLSSQLGGSTGSVQARLSLKQYDVLRKLGSSIGSVVSLYSFVSDEARLSLKNYEVMINRSTKPRSKLGSSIGSVVRRRLYSFVSGSNPKPWR
jgi:hypothetical protein